MDDKKNHEIDSEFDFENIDSNKKIKNKKKVISCTDTDIVTEYEIPGETIKIEIVDFDDSENIDCNDSNQGMSYTTDTDTNSKKEYGSPADTIETEIYSFNTDNSDNNAQLLSGLSLTNRILFDGTFYELNMKKTKSLTDLFALCMKCSNGKEVKGSVRATSNFRSHLKRVHGQESLDELNNYIQVKKTKLMDCDDAINVGAGTSILQNLNNCISTKQTELIDCSTDEINVRPGTSTFQIFNNSTPTKQFKLTDCNDEINDRVGTSTHQNLTSKSVEIKFSQEIFEADILNYIMRSFTPLSTVANPDFWAIFDHMKIPSLKRISQIKLTKHIESAYIKNQNNIKQCLENIEFVCTTADVWSSTNQRFIGVTCHWINDRTLERKSIALACKRFPGTHSLDRIAGLLSEINHEYNLPLAKITGTITENVSNFVKSFKELGIDIKSKNNENDEIYENEIPSFEEIRFLPPHIRCCSHTLSLITTVDIPNAIMADATLKKINECSLKKCSWLWSLVSNPQTSEIIKETIGFTLNTPVITNWNSFYDSVSSILKIGEKLPLLINRLKIEPFTNVDIKYLEEYVRCLNPLAIALDRFQGEEAIYFGYVLPSLLEIKMKYEKLIRNGEIKYFKPILRTIISKLKTRFEQFLSLDFRANNAIIASFSLPVFKTRWLAAIDEVDRDRVRAVFINALKIDNPLNNLDNIKTEHQQQSDDFYFGDDNAAGNVPLTSSVELEALRYFGDPRRDLMMLEEYPVIKRLFLKYNTPLSCSAPVERFFSYATMLNIAKYGCLSDEHFEERVILTVNKDVSI